MSGLISKSAFARKLGVTPSRISQMVRDGLPIDQGTGKIDPDEAIQWVNENVERHEQSGPDSGLLAARTRAANALAETRELDLKVKRGLYADRPSTIAMLRAHRRQVETLLAGFVSKRGSAISRKLGVDPARAEAVLDEEVNALLDELATLLPPPSRLALFAICDLWVRGDRDGESDWDESDLATRAVRLRQTLQEVGGPDHL